MHNHISRKINSQDIRDILKKDSLVKRDRTHYYIDDRLQGIFDTIEEMMNERKIYHYEREIEKFHRNAENIMFALKCVYRHGWYMDALEALYDIFFSDKNYNPNPGSGNLRVNYFTSSEKLFRMRYNDHSDELFKPSEMYHLPIGMNSYVGNSRYNDTGFPMLYLANSVYCAWIETGGKDLNKQNIAVFQPTDRIGYIDVLLHGDNVVISNFATLPLIVACNLPVLFGECKHIPEYIIPQLFMKCIIKARSTGKNIHGVRYISSHIIDDNLIYPNNKHIFERYINYAFPPRGIEYDENGTDCFLKKNFPIVSIESPSGQICHYNQGLEKDDSYSYTKKEIDSIRFRQSPKPFSSMLTYDSPYGALS